MTWRFIPFQRYDPYMKTGLNKVAIEQVQDGRDPILWLAGWDRPCVNVGYTQRVQDEIDLETARDRDLAIVRREGAGGTTYLTPDGELTWNMVAPRDTFPAGIPDLYEHICGEIADALGLLGIDAWFEPTNDVVTANGKLSGATAKQDGDVIYVAGTLLYDVDPETMFEILTPDTDKLDDKPIDAFTDRVTTITAESDASFEDCQESLKRQLGERRALEPDRWTDDETETAREYAQTYRSDAWVFKHD